MRERGEKKRMRLFRIIRERQITPWITRREIWDYRQNIGEERIQWNKVLVGSDLHISTKKDVGGENDIAEI